jgi:hypothetical protein
LNEERRLGIRKYEKAEEALQKYLKIKYEEYDWR